MNIALPAFAGIWTPVHGLLRAVWSRPAPARLPRQERAFQATPAVSSPCVHSAPVRRPLRVVRVAEAGLPRSRVGRMVISGRMADVCAELDRLAASEASLA